MARLIFWAKPDTAHPDGVLVDAGAYKRGMLVDVLEDGADPGRDVVNLPWFRVIDAPGTRAQYTQFLAEMPPDIDPQKIPLRREWRVDLDAIEAAAGKLDASQTITIGRRLTAAADGVRLAYRTRRD